MHRLKTVSILLAAALSGALLSGCQRNQAPPAASGGGMSPDAHKALVAAHDWPDAPAFADATKGLIAAPKGQIKAEDGSVAWDFDSFAFVKGDAPLTAHPGLWRQAKLNNQIGLFKVTEGIWQLRGFDLANISLIQGKTGWIVIDPLTSRETAAYAMAFARQHLGDKPVSAIIYTHSHVDHFGGALGIISAEDAAARKLPIVAPAGFMEEATSETIIAGTAMGRRAMYQFGRDLPRSPEGMIDGGLGKTTSFGHIGILPPTLVVEQPRQELTIDGVRFVFHNVPGSEAPSEFTFEIPDLKAYCGAEMLTHTLHNVMTPRGAKVRDALHWAGYMQEALEHVKGSDVFFASHHWPVFGAERIRNFISAQSDVMKYLHDQTVRMFNSGMNAEEIADQLKVPAELDKFLHTHGYYGSLRHNVRAVFQFYLSSFDGNPANLDTLPRTEVGRRIVELAGGPDKATAAAKAAFDKGDLRWAAQLLDWTLRAQPAQAEARALLVKTYQQLGYAAEASTWRNFYLTGPASRWAPGHAPVQQLAVAGFPGRAAAVEVRLGHQFPEGRHLLLPRLPDLVVRQHLDRGLDLPGAARPTAWSGCSRTWPSPTRTGRIGITIGGGINAFLGVLGWYWVFGWLLISGTVGRCTRCPNPSGSRCASACACWARCS
jgi:alkyl sulfatase BDS1-like metallo-beta-lactamase superfamily hydrolase